MLKLNLDPQLPSSFVSEINIKCLFPSNPLPLDIVFIILRMLKKEHLVRMREINWSWNKLIFNDKSLSHYLIAEESLSKAISMTLTLDLEKKDRNLKDIFELAIKYDLSKCANLLELISNAEMRSHALLQLAEADLKYDIKPVLELIKTTYQKLHLTRRSSYLRNCLKILVKFDLKNAKEIVLKLQENHQSDEPLLCMVREIYELNLDLAIEMAKKVTESAISVKAWEVICIEVSRKDPVSAIKLFQEKLGVLHTDVLTEIVKVELENGNIESAKKIASLIPDNQGISKLEAFLSIVEKELAVDPGSVEKTAQIIDGPLEALNDEHEFKSLKNKIRMIVIKEKVKKDIESARAIARSIDDIESRFYAFLEIAKSDSLHDLNEVKSLAAAVGDIYLTQCFWAAIAKVEFIYNNNNAMRIIESIKNKNIKFETLFSIFENDPNSDIFTLEEHAKNYDPSVVALERIAICAVNRNQLDFKKIQTFPDAYFAKSSVLFEMVKFQLKKKDALFSKTIAEAIKDQLIQGLAHAYIVRFEANKGDLQIALKTAQKICDPQKQVFALLIIAEIAIHR